MPRNFRKLNIRRYIGTVPNLDYAFANFTNMTPSELLDKYKKYADGESVGGTGTTRTPLGIDVHIASSAPRLLGAFPGGGMNTTGYAASRIGTTQQVPLQTPQLTVVGTILATPTNLTFSPWGGTGSLDNAVNGKATRLLRPMFVKVV